MLSYDVITSCCERIIRITWGNDRTSVVVVAVAACMPTGAPGPKFDCQVLIVPTNFSSKLNSVWYMSGPKDLDEGKVTDDCSHISASSCVYLYNSDLMN